MDTESCQKVLCDATEVKKYNLATYHHNLMTEVQTTVKREDIDIKEMNLQMVMDIPDMYEFSKNECVQVTKEKETDENVKNEDINEEESLEGPLFVAVKEEPHIDDFSDESLIEDKIQLTDTKEVYNPETSRCVEGHIGKVEKSEEINFALSDFHEEHSISKSSGESRSKQSFTKGVFENLRESKLVSAEHSTFSSTTKVKVVRLLAGDGNRLEESIEKQLTTERNRTEGDMWAGVASVQEKEGPSERGRQQSNVFSENNYFPSGITITTGEKLFKCSHCEKAFSRKDRLNIHMLIHTGQKLHKCSQCDKSFFRKDKLTAHVRIHTGEKPYQCNQCGKSFTLGGKLKTHMRIHTGEKPFKCSQCDKAFTQRCTVKAHMRVHTGEKPFKCSHCGKAFAQSSNLTVHMQIHSGEKPYKCSHCDKSFSQTTSLTAHQNIHTMVKSYKCNHCEKAFPRKDRLLFHMQIHTGEKLYKCSHCDKEFNRSDKLTAHKRKHTGENINN